MAALILGAAGLVLFDDGGPNGVGFLLMAVYFLLVTGFGLAKFDWHPFKPPKR